jgi:hypothetical protein
MGGNLSNWFKPAVGSKARCENTHWYQLYESGPCLFDTNFELLEGNELRDRGRRRVVRLLTGFWVRHQKLTRGAGLFGNKTVRRRLKTHILHKTVVQIAHINTRVQSVSEDKVF